MIFNIEKPTIGLLNIGSEEMKGHDSLREAATILQSVKGLPGKYEGFVEGNDLGEGTVDVIVTDGFTGNIALKTAEGIGKMAKHYIHQSFTTGILSRIGAVFSYFALKKLKQSLDPRDYNGGPFLGLQGLCIKSHGGTDAYGFSNAVMVGARLVQKGYNKRVAKEIEKLTEQEALITLGVIPNAANAKEGAE